MATNFPLTDAERALYEWQLPIDGLGIEGQGRLKNATVLVSRVGGVGGALALQLASAGVGRLILAHAGTLRADDLNRQTLMSYAGIGRSRVEQAAARLRELNPHAEIVAVNENISETNAERLVSEADVIASCAPLFAERLLLNRTAVRQGKPLVDAAMYELEGQIVTVFPGKTACLACLYPREPAAWNRRFPVLGAVASVIGSLGALEVVKVITGMAPLLESQILICDLRPLIFRKTLIQRDKNCTVCARVASTEQH